MNKKLIFTDRNAFRKWLEKYGKESDGVWLLLRKKGEPVTLSANDALEEALCYGWIDGQMQSIDENVYKKYFARRKTTSNWSEKNKELAKNLIERGLMTPQGLEAIECAKKNGLWDNSKRIIINNEQIELFKQIVKPYELAYTNLIAMSHSIQRTYTGFYLDAKSDKTRQIRLEKIIDRLNKNLKPM
ncbi:YdeI family protein [Dysgonomonas sp. Marseille-P4677]|uniref:YdeI/OmpD-associated family protein n=1 Tax=Dysgonomonas sp. Marseille-P4677 TaxID=2364790 RepID=UPI001F1E0267|nr:hypothetical protein [Dysgonomonas sp. Marseille-P4677]